ncbi:uncharacterized protein [Dysidea avara]|uniref:uncharacterized protein isoform X2 n=1 Tax=Dysidea avara TaxID=196820 RepID=UPI003325A418
MTLKWIDAILESLKKGFAVFKDQDFDTTAKLYTEDCTFIPPGSVPLKGRAATKRAVEELSKTGVVEVKASKEELHPMGEYIFNTNESQSFDKDNKVVDTMNIAIIWRKDDDGEWRILFEMINSQTPPKPPSS